MSRTRLLGALAGAAALGLAVASACGRRAPPPVPTAPPPSAAPDPGSVQKRREEGEKLTEAQTAERDKYARGLLSSCDSRVYRPARDAGLERAAGRIDVKCGSREATYRFAFDVANPAEKPVTFETVSEPAGWDPAVTADVRRWGVLACVSAYEVVAYYRPPIQLGLVPSNDEKNLIVVAPEFRTPLKVSYSMSPQQLVAIRGEWTDAEHKFVTNYDWEPLSGLYLLRGTKVHEGPSTQFDYEHRGNLVLLRTVHVSDRDPGIDAQFKFETIQRRSE
jgi:hypothetical protein